MVEKQIHFIGGGQMTEAIIRAIIHNGAIAKENISVTDIDQSRNRYLTTTYGVEAETGQVHSLKDADLIIIAIRPQDDLVSVSKNIAEFGRKDAIVLSIVAGVTIEKIANHLGEPRPIVRVIPNTLTDTGFGYSGAALNSNANVEDVDWFLNGFGKVSYIDESLIDIFTGYGVAGPNYIYYFIESLVDAGVLAGLSRKQAWDVAIDNIQGAVAMLQQTGKHPRQLMDINNTAGGVGIHALYELNNSNFAEGLQRSVIAAAKRTTELGEGK